ncbi:MAG: hypothetical protein KTR17_02360 [Cellvibrionaceae bacterium]|nr:hypothetical protein [Cellvibrionaceae bacterium]
MNKDLFNQRTGRQDVNNLIKRKLHTNEGHLRNQAKEEAKSRAKEKVKEILDELTGGLIGVVEEAYEGVAVKNQELSPNPWFIANGHPDNDKRYTNAVFQGANKRSKYFKKAGKFVSKAAAKVTQVDVASVMEHGAVMASTGHHLYKLSCISSQLERQTHENSFGTLHSWITTLVRMKQMKLAIRTTQFVGAAVPIDAVGMATDIGVKLAAAGVKMSYTNVCRVVAADLHWRAFQEQTISSVLTSRTLPKSVIESRRLYALSQGWDPEEYTKPTIAVPKAGTEGPASKMVYELFATRGVLSVLKGMPGGRTLDRTKVNKIISEACGWEALSWKLLSL